MASWRIDQEQVTGAHCLELPSQAIPKMSNIAYFFMIKYDYRIPSGKLTELIMDNGWFIVGLPIKDGDVP